MYLSTYGRFQKRSARYWYMSFVISGPGYARCASDLRRADIMLDRAGPPVVTHMHPEHKTVVLHALKFFLGAFAIQYVRVGITDYHQKDILYTDVPAKNQKWHNSRETRTDGKKQQPRYVRQSLCLYGRRCVARGLHNGYIAVCVCVLRWKAILQGRRGRIERAVSHLHLHTYLRDMYSLPPSAGGV